MKRYTVIAGINGVGKSSLRGVLEGQGILLGHVIDADMIAREHHNDPISAGKQAIKEINECLSGIFHSRRKPPLQAGGLNRP